MNPGSPEAVEAGCTCPVFDNANGAGIKLSDGTVAHWRNENCPLHRVPAWDALRKACGHEVAD